MPANKLVIRRLPPTMNEEDFIRQVSPLPNHDYFCFFEACSDLGPHSYSRAYIHFIDPEDTSLFRERFDNYIFLSKDGHEYPAVVEEALWHKSPKSGPFYGQARSITDQELPESDAKRDDETEPPTSIIEQDPEFREFCEKLQSQKKRPRSSPIQTLESNLDDLTSASTSGLGSSKDTPKTTPLIDFLNQKKSAKGGRKGR